MGLGRQSNTHVVHDPCHSNQPELAVHWGAKRLAYRADVTQLLHSLVASMATAQAPQLVHPIHGSTSVDVMQNVGHLVLAHLDLRQLAVCCQVCKAWRTAVNDDITRRWLLDGTPQCAPHQPNAHDMAPKHMCSQAAP